MHARRCATVFTCLLLATSTLTSAGGARTLVALPPSPTLSALNKLSSAGYSSVVAVLKSTGKTDALSTPGFSTTAFLPTDEAFEAIGYSGENVTSLPKDVLTAIIDFHILPNIVADTTVLASGQDFTTLLGVPNVLTVSAEEDPEGPVFFIMGELNEATIVTPDLIVTPSFAAHGIDTVLIPVIEEQVLEGA